MTGQTIEFFIVCRGLLWLRTFVQLIFFIVAINKNQCFIIIKVLLWWLFLRLLDTSHVTWWWHSPCRSPSLSWGQHQHLEPGQGSRAGTGAAHRERTVHSANRWLDDAVRWWLLVSIRIVVVQFAIIILWSLRAFNKCRTLSLTRKV